MRSRAATLMLLALVAVAMAAQTPAGGDRHSNQPTNAGAAIQPSNQNQAATAGSQDSPTENSPSPNSTSIEQVSAGTEMHATLDTPLSTKTSKPGDRFTATISDPVGDNSSVAVIPSGSRVEGEIAEPDGETLAALRDKSKLSLRFRDVVLPNGQALPLTATLISVHDTSGKNTRKTDEEGQIQ